MRQLIRTLAIVALLPLCLPAVAAIAQDSADASEDCAACHEDVVARSRPRFTPSPHAAARAA